MFQSYQDIYDKRGGAYHRAMTAYPKARDREFQALVEHADLPDGPLRVLDVPSGGGYLQSHLPSNARLVCADPAESFLRSGSHEGVEHVICARHEALPFEEASFDAVLSLAGLHHMKNQPEVFREWRRILKPGGILCLGDARRESPTARFLDGVVDRFNSMGHQGLYFGVEVQDTLEQAGFTVESITESPYTWDFESRGDMLDFCRTLFGMDKQPGDEELLDGIRGTVGFQETDASCLLNWSLLFVRARA